MHPQGRGWFITPEQDGDRTLEEQLLGLDLVLAEAAGSTVLDLGCAEGLIGREFALRGATVHGLTIVETEVEAGRVFCAGLPVQIDRCNLMDPAWPVAGSFDIVLALSIAHKMWDPYAFLRQVHGRAQRMIAIRLPNRVHNDARSNHQPIDPVRAFTDFDLIAEPVTCRGEWLGIFKRRP